MNFDFFLDDIFLQIHGLKQSKEREKGSKRETDIYESIKKIKNLDFFKCILRDSIQHPRLAVEKTHATPMPNPRETERERERERERE